MLRLLLVDDNDTLLFAFKKLTLSNGFSVETANSLDAALLMLSNGHYDILLSDLNLTGAATHEGYEIVKAAKKSNPLIRAFIWTAYDSPVLRQEAGELGVEGFLIKPVTFDSLLSAINIGVPSEESHVHEPG